MQTTGTTTIKVRGFPNPIEFADWTHDRMFHTVEFEGGDTQTLLAFVGAAGSTIPGGARTLTVVDTNIVRTGDTGLQAGWEMLIYSIQIEIKREMARTAAGGSFSLQDTVGVQFSRPAHVGGYDPAVVSGGTLFDFARKVFHQFKVNQKPKSEGVIAKYPQGSGISVFGTTTALEVANNGPPSPRDQSAFVLPIWLQPNIGYLSVLAPAVALGIAGGPLAPPFATVGGYFDWSGLPATNMGLDVQVTLEGLVKKPVV